MKIIFSLFAALSILSGCSMTPSSWVNADRLEVHSDNFVDTFALDDLNDETMRAVAGVYNRYGNGPMHVGITTNNNNKANVIKKSLQRYGVKDLKIDTTKPERGMKEMAVISFPALVAKAPESCGAMPSIQSDLPDTAQGDAPYKFGCTVETMLARQVHNPKDLLGRDGFKTNSDGARTEAVVSRRGYYGDAPNKPLKGESSSGE
jgi:type IV pilus biogenesis protein CpaD/CtpE